MLEIYHYLPYKEVLRRGADYFVARIYDEAKNATEPLADTTTTTFQAMAMVMGSLGLCLYLSKEFTGVLLIIIAGLMYGSHYFGAKMHTQSKRQQEWEAELKGVIVGIVHALKETRLFRLLDVVRETYQRAFQKYANATYSWQKITGTYATLSGIFLSWAELLVIIGAGYNVLVGNLTFGSMMAFINAYWFGVNGFRQFINSFPMLSQVLASADRLMELDREGTKSRLAPTWTSGEIWLNGVSFAYDDRPVFQGMVLKISKGERVLIQGPNGSGKSTLALIMAGYLETQEGDVSIPNRISAIIRPIHFPPILLKNLCPRREEKEASEILEKFGLLKCLNSTFDRLSEGQKTKFAVALALLHEADCYILDEPLTAVDQESVEIVMNEILNCTKGKTLVVISHGEAFRDRYDKVFTLQPQTASPATSELMIGPVPERLKGNDPSGCCSRLSG